jgi:predicted nucleic acid-binding protein
MGVRLASDQEKELISPFLIEHGPTLLQLLMFGFNGPVLPYDAMLAALDKRNGNKKNNAQDILIAITALNRQLTLVTDDASLSSMFREFGGTAESFDEFLRHAS